MRFLDLFSLSPATALHVLLDQPLHGSCIVTRERKGKSARKVAERELKKEKEESGREAKSYTQRGQQKGERERERAEGREES